MKIPYEESDALTIMRSNSEEPPLNIIAQGSISKLFTNNELQQKEQTIAKLKLLIGSLTYIFVSMVKK